MSKALESFRVLRSACPCGLLLSLLASYRHLDEHPSSSQKPVQARNMSNSSDPTATQEAPPMLTALPSRPHGIETEIYLIATAMTVLPLIAIGLRFYARNLKKTGLSWDDFSILPAMVRYLCQPYRSPMAHKFTGLYRGYCRLYVHW